MDRWIDAEQNEVKTGPGSEQFTSDLLLHGTPLLQNVKSECQAQHGLQNLLGDYELMSRHRESWTQAKISCNIDGKRCRLQGHLSIQ